MIKISVNGLNMAQKHSIAIISPCYNESDGLYEFHKVVRETCDNLKDEYRFDIFLVNDGSADNTQEVIKALEKQDPHLYHLEFAANFGHQSALRAGIEAVAGADKYDAILMLDADLQHPPRYFRKMLDLWRKGYLIVQMARDDKDNNLSFFKNVTSKAYYQMINRLANLEMHAGSSDFRLIDKTVATTIAVSPEQNIFLRGYFAWLPVKRINVSYTPEKRHYGTSKYNLKKMLQLGYRGILQFSEKPLVFIMGFGAFLAAISFLYGIFTIVQKIMGHTASGWASLMAVTLFFFGINFLFLGLIGIYLAYNMRIIKSRPEYIIREHKLPE